MDETVKISETRLRVPNLAYYAQSGRKFYVTHKIGGRFNPEEEHLYRVNTQDQVDELSDRYVAHNGDILEWYYEDEVEESSRTLMQQTAKLLAPMMRWRATLE